MEVALRPLCEADFKMVLSGNREECWAGDYPSQGDREAAELGMVAPFIEPPWCHYQIVIGASGLVVGQAGFHGPPTNEEVEIGYGVVPSARDRGIATAAVAALLEIALARVEVRQVKARVEASNVASQRVLDRCGFGVERRRGSRLFYVRGR